jgi:hypothetical protein
MRIPSFTLPSNRPLIFTLLVISLVLVAAGKGAAAFQTQKVQKTSEGGVVAIKNYKEIPEATEPCSPEVREWWGRIREAGNYLQKNESEKAKRRFYLLLQEGQQKGYRVPLKDRPKQVLAEGELPYLPQQRFLNGSVVLSVEFLADGTVGDIQVVTGFGSFIDKHVVQATRRDVFLPAVKDGAFVTYRDTRTTHFSNRRN